ncbi:hypothetical protein MMSP_3195 [Mycobacterium sp. 012931]|nr:hypothetical protein MMSP_3195 [Mycobacterium sp. 012931]
MANTITFRPDEDTTKALEVLTKDGTSMRCAALMRHCASSSIYEYPAASL